MTYHIVQKIVIFYGTGWSTKLILLLESVDYFGTNGFFSGWKKEESLWAKLQQSFNGEATCNWLGVINFHCMQMILMMSMRFFGDDWNDMLCSSRFCCLVMMLFLLNWSPWFSCIYTHTLNQFRNKLSNAIYVKVNILKNTWPSIK